MIQLKETMVWWNDREEATDYPGCPQIAVLSRLGKHHKYSYLTNSLGACFAGWSDADPVKLAGHLLAVFAAVTGQDGVPVEEAQREFMKIAEYREWIETASGPFAEASAAWRMAA